MLVLTAIACRPPAEPIGTRVEPEPSPHERHSYPHHSGHTGTVEVEPFDGPLLLSEAGLYEDLAADVLAAGTLSVVPTYPLWSDGSTKRRWLRVPDGSTIDTSDPDHWLFPVGTLAFKEFVADGVRVETRRMEKTDDGWDLVSYQWRADGSDADAVPDGAEDVLGTRHDIPDQLSCKLCHVGPADLMLGIDAVQLDATVQATLPLSAPVVVEIPGDDVARAALGYLHGNCGSCHRTGALAGDRTELLLSVVAGLTDPALSDAVRTGVGKVTRHAIDGTTIAIVPGDPAASQLWTRMTVRNLEGMPPRGTEVVDDAGVAIIGDWITSLTGP